MIRNSHHRSADVVHKARRRPTLWLLAALAICCFADAAAGAQRALLVGIDRYRPEAGAVAVTRGRAKASASWVDLRGAVNDAEALRAILQGRFGFPSESVRVLTDGEATRDGILNAIREHLIEASGPGDVNLFYFAGHGSQLRNAASTEADLLDETIVPADANRGAADIRDKELRSLFNDVLDRGAELVVILDSCHSGSATRSFHAVEDVRTLPPRYEAEAGAATPPFDPRGAPEERGALVLAATSDGELARESRDASGEYHGAFSVALFEALGQAPADEPVSKLFARTRALLGSGHNVQTPVLAGSLERRERALFGAAPATARPGRHFAALGPADGDSVVLRAGTAAGIFRGSELVSEETSVRIQVEQVSGLNRSTARVLAGDPEAVRTGTLFRVVRWAHPTGGALQVALPALVPPTLRQELAHSIPSVPGVELVSEAQAHYVLAADHSGPAPELHWQRRTGEASGLPPRGAGIPETAPNAAALLAENARRLAVARNWLLLESPENASAFPYRLVLRDTSAGRVIPGGVVFEGDRFELMLQRRNDVETSSVEQRYVYVFVVDGYGERALLFPRAESGNVGNRVPVSADEVPPPLVPLGRTGIEVAPPFGTDTLVLLSTEDPIDDPTVLVGEARRTRSTSWVESLLEHIGSGPAAPRPAGWAIDRVPLRSMPRS